MHPQAVHATNPSPRQAPLSAVRAAVLARRIKASPSVAALLGELCFGTADQDRGLAVLGVDGVALMGAARMKARRPRADRDYDAAGRADRRWFEANPGRATRIRRATDGEMDAQRMWGVLVPPLRSGVAWFCVVRQLMPGLGQRLFVSWYADDTTDVSEKTADEVYRKVRSSAEARFEADIHDRLTPNGRAVH